MPTPTSTTPTSTTSGGTMTSRQPPHSPVRTPAFVQVEHLPEELKPAAVAAVQAGLAASACPPTYVQRARSGRLSCNCPPDDARYDAAECRHAPEEKHTGECVVWCATCSPPGPETIPADVRHTPRGERLQLARNVLEWPAPPDVLRRALREVLDEVAVLTAERNDARFDLVRARRGGGK